MNIFPISRPQRHGQPVPAPLSRALLAAALCVFVSLPHSAHAQEPPPLAPALTHDPVTTRAAEPTPVQKARDLAQKTFATIAQKGGCRAQAIADPQFFADTAAALALFVHSRDASLMVRNKNTSSWRTGPCSPFWCSSSPCSSCESANSPPPSLTSSAKWHRRSKMTSTSRP